MLNIATEVTLVMLAVSVLLAFIRLLRGPTLPDRVVAIDLIGVLLAGLIVVGAAVSGERAFLDVGIVISLLSFVGTVAYARFVEREKHL